MKVVRRTLKQGITVMPLDKPHMKGNLALQRLRLLRREEHADIIIRDIATPYCSVMGTKVKESVILVIRENKMGVQVNKEIADRYKMVDKESVMFQDFCLIVRSERESK